MPEYSFNKKYSLSCIFFLSAWNLKSNHWNFAFFFLPPISLNIQRVAQYFVRKFLGLFKQEKLWYRFTSHLVVSEPSVCQSEADGAALLFEFSVALDERLQRWRGGGEEMKNDREDEECRVNKSALLAHARTDLFWRHKHKRGNKCRDVTGIVSLLAATRKPAALTQ